MTLKPINKLQAVSERDVYNKVFCEYCMCILGYTLDESHDITLSCEDCIK